MSASSSSRRTAQALMRSPSGRAAAIALLVIVVLAIVGPIIWGGAGASKQDFGALNAAASSAHPLGTDDLGRDILHRTLAATRLSMLLGLAAAAISLGIGFPAGALIALLGPRLRGLGRGLINTLLSFPSLLLAIVIVAIIGIGQEGAVLAIGLGGAPYFARLSESLASSAAAREYVASARVIGIGRWRLVGRYVLPNIAETLTIAGLTAVAESIIDVSALSFLGLGVQPPSFDWGTLLTSGVQEFYLVPTAPLGPAIMIAFTGLTFTLLAEALARALNPRLWDGGTGPLAKRRRLLGSWRAAIGGRAPATTATSTADSAATGAEGTAAALLEVTGLTVTVPGPDGPLMPVRGISFVVRAGEVVGIVGESGSGKTLTALSVAQLVPHPATVSADTLSLSGQDLQSIDSKRLHRLLGTTVATVFQNPMASLNPALRVGTQLTDGFRTHRNVTRRDARSQAEQRLVEVNIPRARQAMRRYPFEFSGGMRQRAMIAMGLMSRPALLIADEPTTALDVTVQAQVLEVLRTINRDHGTAVLLISHNVGVVSEICDRVLVMYAGQIVEDLSIESLTGDAAHPYTRALMSAVPSLDSDRDQPLADIPGQPYRLGDNSVGCPFAPRCPLATERCHEEQPSLLSRADGHRVACWVANPDHLEVAAHD